MSIGENVRFWPRGEFLALGLLRLRVYSNAQRMQRSHAFARVNGSLGGHFIGVPFFMMPPTPQYISSVFSRNDYEIDIFGFLPTKGVSTPDRVSHHGRRLMY